MRPATQYSEGRVFHIGVRIGLRLHRFLWRGHGWRLRLRLRFIHAHGWHRLPAALLALAWHSLAAAAHSLRAAQNHAE